MCMKVILLVVLLILLPAVPAPSSSFSAYSDGTVGVKDDGMTLLVSREELLVKTPHFSFGAMGEGGIISVLDHPFSSASLSPSFSPAGNGNRTVGSCVSYGGFFLFSFFGERGGAGVLYEGERWKAGAVYASPGNDDGYQKEVHLRTDRHTFWVLGEYDGTYLVGRVMSSISGKGYFSSLLQAGVKLSAVTLTCGRGNVQAFSDGADRWQSMLSASIRSDSFSITHTFRYASEPVYIREYRDYEYLIRGKLRIGDFILSDSVTKSFTSGKTKRSEKIVLEWNGISLGWNTGSTGVLCTLSNGGVDVEWEEGKLSVQIRRAIESGNGRFTFSLSSSGSSEWIYTYTY